MASDGDSFTKIAIPVCIALAVLSVAVVQFLGYRNRRLAKATSLGLDTISPTPTDAPDGGDFAQVEEALPVQPGDQDAASPFAVAVDQDNHQVQVGEV